MFKGLAHPVRVRILELLAAADEVTVTQLLDDLGLEPSHLSQHLAVLRRHRLVESERRGSFVFYSLTHREVAELLGIARRLLVLALRDDRELADATQSLPELIVRGEG